MNERDQWIWRLQEIPGLGAQALGRILGRYGAPDGSLFGRDMSYYRQNFKVSEPVAQALSDARTMAPAAPHLPVRALLSTDADYPAPLRAWKTAPPLLWTVESTTFPLTYGNICVVASAGAEGEMAELCKRALQIALESGYALVAGHNRPVYQWALLAAKRAGAPAWMPLDRGLQDAFDGDLARDPVAAARIWGYGFEPERCVALSPFRLADGWIGANSRIRDALVVGLSDIILAVGIRAGGTMHGLCREALARGRVVYADAGSLPLLAAEGARPWEGRLDR